MDFSKITTDPELIKRLEQASKRNLTAEEIQKQKASFVWGQLPHDHPMSKDEVAEHLGGFKSIDQINEERIAEWHRQLDDLKASNITVTHDLSDDGFNPFGSGPEPIGPRNDDCGP
ncbi:hypothetical protein [Paremcibacter congregatus]|uniref:hypothetical protein n=1 Tax=Paremcibacter congregatus TaxID=2043170 RepID=UPI003A92D574